MTKKFHKFAFVFFLIFLPSIAHAYEEFFDLLPPDAIYKEELSRDLTDASNVLTTTIAGGKEVRIFSEQHVFTTNASFLSVVDTMNKRVEMIQIDKDASLEKMDMEGVNSKSKIYMLLEDPEYLHAYGFIGKWMVHIYSFYENPVTKEVIDTTTIVFTRHPFRPALAKVASQPPAIKSRDEKNKKKDKKIEEKEKKDLKKSLDPKR